MDLLPRTWKKEKQTGVAVFVKYLISYNEHWYCTLEVSLRPEDEFFRRLLNLISFWTFIWRHQSRIGLSRKLLGENNFLILTMWKRNERCESRGTSKTSKSYNTFTLTQDLLHKSHVTRNLSLMTHLLKIFLARWYIFSVLLLDDFSFNIYLLGDVTPSWLRTRNDMYWDNGLSKTEQKRLRTCMVFMTHSSFCIDHLKFLVPIRNSLPVYVEFWKLVYI